MLVEEGLGQGPELHGGQGSPRLPILLPMGVVSALSLVYLLGEIFLPGEWQ